MQTKQLQVFVFNKAEQLLVLIEYKTIFKPTLPNFLISNKFGILTQIDFSFWSICRSTFDIFNKCSRNKFGIICDKIEEYQCYFE